MVRLIETKQIDNQEEPIRFAALSYCWGQPKLGDNDDWRTTKTSLGSHLVGIPRRALPKTLQDGILIAEKLNIPYIWIDALCIVQDDTDDWAREAAKMSGIYLGSVLTIAVASSASGDEGCFNTQSQSIISSPRFRRDWFTVEGKLEDGRRSCLYISNSRHINDDLDMYRNQVLAGPLTTRAWTLQEQVLPRRMLFYTSKQLVWKCTHCLINEENFPQRQHQELYPILDFDCPLVPEAVDELWYEGVVERYSKRNITVASDKLVAISALAKATYLNRHIDYVAGLWKDCLLSGTLWRRASPGCKNKVYTCPSWSWASQNSVVSYDWSRNRTWGGSMFMPKVVDVLWKPGPASLFGDVVSASIHVDTRIRIGTLTRDYSLSVNSGTAGLSQSLVLSNSDNTKILHAEAIMDDERTIGGSVVMAIMSGCRGNKPRFLLLSPPDLDADEYRRIGIARLDVDGVYPEFEAEDKVNSGWERRIIKLI